MTIAVDREETNKIRQFFVVCRRLSLLILHCVFVYILPKLYMYYQHGGGAYFDSFQIVALFFVAEFSF